MSRMPESSGKLHLSSEELAGIRVHEKARHMPALPAGPFVRLGDGGILGVAGAPAQAYASGDEGATWTALPMFAADVATECSCTGALLCSKAGTVIVAFADLASQHWTWSDDLKDAPGDRLPTCVMRSADGGRTWQDLQTLHTEWTGATRDIIQMRSGRIVFCSMKLLHDPGRHSVMCYCSDDDGMTWLPSNVMDLGGNGHHGGVTEGTILECADGRLLQYMRTNWGELWRAVSDDGGLRWHPYGPSGIPASSAPPLLKRLASGRVALLWNRPTPEGEDTYPLIGGDGLWSATPVSNFRQELSLSFSEDECESWSAPVVIARAESDDQGRNPEVTYPYAFEPEPGTLWITAHRWDLRMSLREEDFAN